METKNGQFNDYVITNVFSRSDYFASKFVNEIIKAKAEGSQDSYLKREMVIFQKKGSDELNEKFNSKNEYIRSSYLSNLYQFDDYVDYEIAETISHKKDLEIAKINFIDESVIGPKVMDFYEYFGRYLSKNIGILFDSIDLEKEFSKLCEGYEEEWTIITKFIFSEKIIKNLDFKYYSFYEKSDNAVDINDIEFDFDYLEKINNKELKKKLKDASENRMVKRFVLAQIYEYGYFINYATGVFADRIMQQIAGLTHNVRIDTL